MKRSMLFVVPVLLFVFPFLLAVKNYQTAANFSKKEIISCPPQNISPDSVKIIFPNDNRLPAGYTKNGILYIELEARAGIWYPDSHDGSGLSIYAFAERGKPMQVPGPLLRVKEGTRVKISVKNLLPTTHPLIIYGLNTKPGNDKDSIVIEQGEEKQIEFVAGKAGTYSYRGVASDSLLNSPPLTYQLPYQNDSQLYGGFIIDSLFATPVLSERIFIIGVWNSKMTIPDPDKAEFVINGLSWPHTERLQYKLNEAVNWRIINASNQPHPMHLHGFYFTVKSIGSLNKDSIIEKRSRPKVVTQLLVPLGSMSISWNAERAGNWLFHCHILTHVMPVSFLKQLPPDEGHMHKTSNHAQVGMGGLIMGIHIKEGKETDKASQLRKERHLTMVIGEKKSYFDALLGKGFFISAKKNSIDYKIPGEPLILVKNEPVAIKILNKLDEPTTIHWHGLEIESYYDGAAGWGNKGKLLAPLIQPGDSFVVHIKPPRAGTFIYHTHMHNFQLVQGMSGPLIVTDPGKKFNPEFDKIFFISQGDEDIQRRLFFLNGKVIADTMKLKHGGNYRLRFINITADGPFLSISLLRDGQPVQWKLIAKDGLVMPSEFISATKASRRLISVGETMDYTFRPLQKGKYVVSVHRNSGMVVCSQVLQVQ